MIHPKIKLYAISILLVCPIYAFANKNTDGSAGTRGGGDPCQNEINKHRLAIQGWIIRDEAKDLDFKKAKIEGLTYDDPIPAKSYKRSMLDALQEGKVVVTCYLDPARIHDPDARKIAQEQGVTYKEITIGNPLRPYTCINYEDAGTSRIDCNYDLVMSENSLGKSNFKNTHHEFAVIAGIEERKDTFPPDFSVSNQIADFKRLELVEVLGPKKLNSQGDCTDCDGMSATGVRAKINAIYSSSTLSHTLKVSELEAFGTVLGAAACSDGQKIFYLPVAFRTVTKEAGPFRSKIAAYSFVSMRGLDVNSACQNPEDAPEAHALCPIFRSFEAAEKTATDLLSAAEVFKDSEIAGLSRESPTSLLISWDSSVIDPNNSRPRDSFEVRATTGNKLVFLFRKSYWDYTTSKELTFKASCIMK